MTEDTPSDYRSKATSHIRSLSSLSTSLPSLLAHAATTVSQLTNSPIPLQNLPPISTADSPDLRIAAIESSARDYLSSVSQLRTALLAQIDDLEKEGVVPKDEVRYRAPVQQQQQQSPPSQGQSQASVAGTANAPRDSESKVTNGGLGNFDVGVLNARAGVRERDGEELLDRVRKNLEEVLKRMGDGGSSGKDDEEGVKIKDEVMQGNGEG